MTLENTLATRIPLQQESIILLLALSIPLIYLEDMFRAFK